MLSSNAYHPTYYHWIMLNFEICIYTLYKSRNLNLFNYDKYSGEHHHHLRVVKRQVVEGIATQLEAEGKSKVLYCLA